MKQERPPLEEIKENATTALYYSITGLILPVLGNVLLIFAGVRAGKTLRLIRENGTGSEYKGKARAALIIVFVGLSLTVALVWWNAFK
jgi:hypothetical protein